MPHMQTDFVLVCKWKQIRQDAGSNGLSRPTCWHYEINWWGKSPRDRSGWKPPSLPPCHEMRVKWAHQSGVDSGWICAVGEVIGVILAGGGRSGVGRAVHPKRCVQLRPAARQEPILVRGTAEGGGGGGCGGLGGACPVRNRPGNRIAASRTGVCRHEKLHEEKREQTWSFAVSALIWMW